MATAELKTYTWGTGRRKTAVARVRIREGSGQFLVNDLEADAYFLELIQRLDAHASLGVTEMGGRVDVWVNVNGGGKSSQSGAVRLGLARALKEFRPDLEPILRENGFLTRDARKVERKKVRAQEGAEELPVLEAVMQARTASSSCPIRPRLGCSRPVCITTGLPNTPLGWRYASRRGGNGRTRPVSFDRDLLVGFDQRAPPALPLP